MSMSSANTSGYTAVVYFHGMGSQRRYEELSRLIDALDQFAFVHRLDHSVGTLKDIQAKLEQPRGKHAREVSYVTLEHQAKQKDDSWSRREYRFYEAYWAHVTAGGVPVKEVLIWLIAQVAAPLQALLCTPWRLRARLRRAALLEIWPKLVAKRNSLTQGDLKRLLEAYDAFEGWEARRDYPKGRAREFFEFVHARSDGAKADLMVWLARQWHCNYVGIELRNLFYLVTTVLTLFLVGLGLAAIAAGALQWLTQILPADVLAWLGPDSLKASASNLTIAAGVLLTAIGGARFLRDFFGDVQFWTTYQETSSKNQKRREILETCANTLSHVLLDPNCARIVVVGHSLGTTVAFDTILELARRNRAEKLSDTVNSDLPLAKIQHFITLASPIDKVHYFFESHAGKYHRYNRVIEEIRGDLGTFPFSRSGRPLMHWINFWDRADIIGGALQTPSNRNLPSLAVDNVEVGNYFFPEPGSAHSAYFEHAAVIETIYHAVFNNDYNYLKPPLKKDGKPDFAAARLGPGRGESSTLPFQALMLAFPWLCFAYLLLAVQGLSDARILTGYLVAILTGTLLVGWLQSKILCHLHGLNKEMQRISSGEHHDGGADYGESRQDRDLDA